MKQLLTILAALVLTIAAQAQTLKITAGGQTYSYAASELTSSSPATFASGSTMTIGNQTFSLSDITSMEVTTGSSSSSSDLEANTVSIVYDGSSATVTAADNVAAYVSASVSGAHVTITQSNTDAVDGDEITYVLSGSTTDGSLTLGGSYKCTVSLDGLTLTNPNGAAINITNSKRIQLSAKKGTENTLADGSGSQKACIYSKGQIQLQGNGTLNVSGNYKHAIKSASYISIKNLTLNITSAVSDGINCEEYLQMKSGTVTISGVGDDGIQCDLGGTTSTGETTDHEDEDTGNVYIEGGTLNVTATGTATKCVKCDGSISVTDGTITLNANGGIDTSDTSDLSYAAGFKADGDFTQSGGTIVINVTGASGRGIGVDGTFTSASGSTGTLTITNSGALSSSGSTYFATAKGIKAGVVAINGGTIDVTMSGEAAKGIKSDSDDGSGNMTITGGTVTITTSGAGAYDGTDRDAKGAGCLKANNNMTISGGTLTLKSTGTGGKAIKADGTLTVSDGTISATASGSQYRYSSSLTASPKAIKSTGAMTISGGSIYAKSSSHEGIESKSTMTISGGDVYAEARDDAINSAGDMTITGGYVMANSTGNDGLDANGNCYIKGGNVFAVATTQPEVGIDANTEQNKQLYITGGNVVAIGGFENGASISGGTAQSASYSKNTWYGLYNGSTLAFAFKVPSNNSMGSTMAVYTTSTPALKSGVTGIGTSFWNGAGYTNCSGGSDVTLSTYNGGNGQGGGPGGGGNQGGGNRPGGRW